MIHSLKRQLLMKSACDRSWSTVGGSRSVVIRGGFHLETYKLEAMSQLAVIRSGIDQ